MIGDLPALLEAADERARTFPASWRDAAVRLLWDSELKGVRCPGCQAVFRRPAELRRLQGDHVVPFSRGGLTVWSNMQLLCRACNLKKHARLEGVEPARGVERMD